MTKLAENPLVLVDGSSYLYRAFHAFPSLTNSQGEPTGAMYGVLNMLRSLIQQVNPSHMAVVFDAKGKTFRDDLFEDYKAHRPPMPKELRLQIEPLHQMIRAQGIPVFVVEGVEADDVIGTLALKASKQGQNVLISTVDKDMAQLVDDHVMLINTMNNSLLDRSGVVEKYGIPPELIIDFLALMGDSSDNIPGVPGVGEKTALTLLQGLGNMQTIYAQIDNVASLPIRGAKTLGKKLLDAKANAELSYLLATIKTDVALDIQEGDLALTPPNQALLSEYFQRYEFKKWLGTLSQDNEDDREQKNEKETALSQVATETHTEVSPITIDRRQYQCIADEESLQHWVQRLTESALFALDTETNSLNAMQAHLVGISFSLTDGSAAYLPLQHDTGLLETVVQLPMEFALSQLKPILENPNIHKVGQHIKFDMNVLARHGIQLQGVMFDTMLESYVLESTDRHNMDYLAQKHLHYQTVSFEEVVGKGKNQLTFNQIEIERATEYAAEDADITFKLHQVLWPRLEQVPSLKTLFTTMEMPLIGVLARMEQQGVQINQAALAQQSLEMTSRLAELEQKAYDLSGKQFNLASPKQLQQILFDELKLPVLRKTPKGVPSTNEEVLEELAMLHELPRVLVEYRMLNKLKSTYTDKLPLLVNPETGRLHTSYHQAVTTTGRLSSSDPNLQNIPIRNAEGRRIRQAFIPKLGFKLMAADYSQIELRLMAELSQDKNLLHAFAKGLDIHQATAAEIFNLPLSEVSVEQRRSAKAINFGLIYGMSAFGLAKQLNISRTQAQNYINTYFKRYPSVKQFMLDIPETAKKQGFVETLYGRRLHLPDIRSSHAIRRKAAERLAINAPMQGSAADIIKHAMIAIDHHIQHDPNISMIMQVHDELVFEVEAGHVEQYRCLIKQLMEQVVQLSVPLIVEIGVGDNWDEAH